jgi:hypothetical protein
MVYQESREKPKSLKGEESENNENRVPHGSLSQSFCPKHRTQSYLEFSLCTRDSPPRNAVRLSDGQTSRVCPDERAEFCKVPPPIDD